MISRGKQNQTKGINTCKLLHANFFPTILSPIQVSNSTSKQTSRETKVGMATNEKRVVLVTGGAGFLGQHIVYHLRKQKYVKEIRVLDVKSYHPMYYLEDNTGSSEVPVTSVVGDIRDRDTVVRACQGVSSVFHVAGLVSFGTFPDYEGMQQVNVQGTKNVIFGCLATQVQRLIFCSTVDVAIGYDNIIYGNEQTTPVPPTFLFPGYPQSKHEAETEVLNAHKQRTSNGNKLQTVSLRANVMYGEGDPYYVVGGLKSAASHGKLQRIGSRDAQFQQAYVGNTAWAFVCAERALLDNKDLGGDFYYIPDDTPVQNSFSFMKPFVEMHGLQVSDICLPWWAVYYPVYIMEKLLYLLSPLTKLSLPVQSCTVRYISMDLFFDGTKARKKLKYKPLYNPEEALRRSIVYYESIKL